MPNKITIDKTMTNSFQSEWTRATQLFSANYIDLYYKIMPCKKRDDDFVKCVASQTYNHFNYFRNGGCAENIVFPIFILNNNKLMGDYKVLTNNQEEYHFVIYKESTNEIFDPTYEKARDDKLIDGNECVGLECTFEMLGSECIYMDLKEYLEIYDVPNCKTQTEANREFYNILLNQTDI